MSGAVILALGLVLGATEAPPAQVRTAWYWESRGRDDRAAEAWGEALAAGDRADALAALGSWHARGGRLAEARDLLSRLVRGWPGSPEARQLEHAVEIGARHAGLLARAREAARTGRLDDALARYRELFGAAPPPGHLAAEYWEACAGSSRSVDEGVAGLAELVLRVPASTRYRLALARALTYRPSSRLDGVARLEALEADPAVGRDADAALRRALGWLSPGTEADLHLGRWLARHPADAEIAALRARSGSSSAVDAGYRALARGDLGDARRRFAEAGPGDARALAGFSLVALRERDYGTARALAEKARDLAPAEVAAWEGPLRSATFWDLVSRARSALSGGRAEEARGLLAEASVQPGADRREVELALAEVDEVRGAHAEAEARLRALSVAHPRDGVVLRRLVDALARAGKRGEALAVNDALARVAPSLALDAGPLRAGELRDRAAALRSLGDADGARAALDRARALDARDPWPVHDLAQLALERGD
ncbi:MAG TPA: hypothetical protein VFP65_12355, partial [Anaeromyxobacteraceae bacterium]|nr:hypothetical protein [Anaeromyxobacteraceae bacterium]